MAEDLLPTIAPGMVGVRNKATGRVVAHFPVDAREILAQKDDKGKGQYELVDNGAVEAARMNANPLKAAQAAPDLIHSEVTGIEGQVLVAMSPEQAAKWKELTESTADKEVGTKQPSPTTPERTETAAPATKTAATETKPAATK